jgi:hypothetical protein
MASNPDSKPKEGGIPDIMRGIGNMLRIAILEYNYKASQKELTKVLSEVDELKSGNDNLESEVTRLTSELGNAIRGWTDNFHAWQQLQHINTQLGTRLQDNIAINTRLTQELQQARQRIEALTDENQGLRNAFTPLRQQLGLAQQQNHEQQNQLHQLDQQLKQAKADTVAAQQQAATDVAAAQQEATTARAAAEARVIAVERAQQQAQAHVAELKDQLTNTETLTEVQIQSLKSQLETAQQDARAAADEAQRARAAEAAARAASETAQQRVIEKEAEVEQERLRMAENAERERDAERNAAAAARAQITAAQQEATEATARAAESDTEVKRLQQELAEKQGLSEEQVATLKQQLEEAVRKAAADKTAVQAANVALRKQLDQQAQDAQVAAEAAAIEQQRLTAELADLRQHVGITGNQNADLETQIARVQRELDAANDNAQKTQQNAEQAAVKQAAAAETERQQAAAEVEAVRQRVQELETQLKQAKENGNTTADQRAALEKQLHQQQEAAEEARRAQQDALERAEEAERASEEFKQQKFVSAIRSAAFKSKANTAARAQQEAQQKLAEQQAAAETARKEAQEATQRAEDARKEAEAQAQTQQREIADALAILKETLTGSLGHVRDKITRDLGEDQQANLNRGADTISTRIQGMPNAESFNGINAAIRELDDKITRLLHQAEAQRREEREREQADEHAARQQSLDRAIGNFRQQLDGLPSQIDAAPISDATKAQLRQEVIDLTNVLPSIRQMDDAVYNRVRDGIQSINERLGTKIRTFIAMKGGGTNNGNFKFKDDKTVTYSHGQAQSTTWGPFTSTFDYSKTNLDKFNDSGIKTALEPLTTDSKTVVIFGYGYSGSGKTYTLLGKRKKTVDQVIQAIESQYSANFEPISTQHKGIIKRRLESIQQSGDSHVDVNLFELYTQSVNRARRIVIDDDAQRAIQTIRDYANLKSIIEKNTADLFDVPGITHLAIEDFIKKNCSVSVSGVYEMYNENYSANARLEYTDANGSSKFAPEEFTQYTRAANSVLENSHHTFTDKINAFNEMCIRIETFRKHVEHIMPTPNNPESSRGHLFIHLKIQNQANNSNSNLIICDMGGRENPNEIWNDGKYCMFYNGTNGTIKPIIKGKTNEYYDDNMAIQTCSDPVTAGKVFSGRDTTFTLATAMAGSMNRSETKKQQDYILRTIKQGFYINDSINELLRFFKYERDTTTTHTSGWDAQKLNYDPAIIRTPKGISRLIGIKDLFTEFSNLTPDNIKYCTFACIRPEETFDEDSKQTMNFATQVNSCPDARTDAAAAAAVPRVAPPAAATAAAAPRLPAAAPRLPAARVGGSIRRQRRKKHAIFKTLKKSRLGFSASDSASASGLASDSNSVKVKHKTRNKKKHNTRNNTVKK